MAIVYIVDENYKIEDTITSKKLVNYINKYKQEKDRNMSLVAYKLLYRLIIDNYNLNINELSFNKNEYGALIFDEFQYSISHSNSLICVAISRKNIGVDIEKINDNRIDLLANKILTNEEAIQYKSIVNKDEFVFLKWSKLEAYYKSINTGFNGQSFKINVENDISKIIYDKQHNKYSFSCVSVEKDVKIVEVI